MKKQFFALCFVCFLFFLIPNRAFAVTVTINQYPPLVSNDPFSIDVSVLGASAGKNYLRADLYKDGTSNYFGETFSGSDWYGKSDGQKYFPIDIADSKSTASANFQVRIGTPTAGEFPGAGSYKLKIRRYTSSGNPASSDDQSPVDIQINYSSPIATTNPTSNPTSTKTTTKTPTPSKVIATATQIKTTQAVITSQKTANSAKITQGFNVSSKSAKLRVIQTPTKASKEVKVLGAKDNKLSVFLVIGGLFLLIAGGSWFGFKIIKEKGIYENFFNK